MCGGTILRYVSIISGQYFISNRVSKVAETISFENTRAFHNIVDDIPNPTGARELGISPSKIGCRRIIFLGQDQGFAIFSLACGANTLHMTDFSTTSLTQ